MQCDCSEAIDEALPFFKHCPKLDTTLAVHSSDLSNGHLPMHIAHIPSGVSASSNSSMPNLYRTT